MFHGILYISWMYFRYLVLHSHKFIECHNIIQEKCFFFHTIMSDKKCSCPPGYEPEPVECSGSCPPGQVCCKPISGKTVTFEKSSSEAPTHKIPRSTKSKSARKPRRSKSKRRSRKSNRTIKISHKGKEMLDLSSNERKVKLNLTMAKAEMPTASTRKSSKSRKKISKRSKKSRSRKSQKRTSKSGRKSKTSQKISRKSKPLKRKSYKGKKSKTSKSRKSEKASKAGNSQCERMMECLQNCLKK